MRLQARLVTILTVRMLTKWMFPSLAFILYRQHHQSQVIAENPKLSNPEISKIIGQKWKSERQDIKDDWKRLAEEEKQRHQLQYPDYRYQPRRGSRAQGGRGGPSPTDDQDRCSKCSGRLISTPRTPATSYPTPSQTPTSRSSEGTSPRQPLPDHPTSANASYTPRLPSVRDVDVWETPLPEMKRRRANGAGEYHSTAAPPEHYRVQSVRQPTEVLRDSYASRRASMPYPGVAIREQYSPPGPFNAAMPPPPRPGPSGPWPAAQEPRSGFDESLRLPPLQTAIPASPRRTPLTDSRYSQAPTGSLMPPSSRVSPPRSFEAQIMTLPFKRKLEVLARVCRPAPTPGPDHPFVEARGAFVAVEGYDTKMVQAVGLAVEAGFQASEDLALKVWAGDISSRDETKREFSPESVGGRSTPVGDAFPSNCFQTILQWQDKVREISSYVTRNPGSRPEHAGEVKLQGNKVPVALIKDGFSLTISDRLACVSPILDTYQLQDHWQWMASLWRGTICPDLVIYVKPAGDDEIGHLGTVEFIKRMGLIIVRMAAGRALDEATERRLTFEVMEWVREGSFRDKVPRLWRQELS